MDIFVIGLISVLIVVFMWIFDQQIRRFFGNSFKPKEESRQVYIKNTNPTAFKWLVQNYSDQVTHYESHDTVMKKMDEQIKANDEKLSKFKPPYET